MFRKNTASQFIHVQGVDSTTGGIKSGVTWTVRRCIDGTFAAATGTATEDGTTGWYKFAMSQADTNGNDIGFNFTGTGAVPQTVNIVTTAADPTDVVRFGLTALPNAAAEAAGGLYTRGTGAGQIRQDANGRIDANAKAWIDGTIPAVNVTGVPLVDLKYTLGTISPATAGSVRADSVTGITSSDVGAIKTVTDKFAFTVTNQVDANVLSLATALRPGIRKNTALSKFEFLMTDSTNHNPAALLTVAVTRSIDGGAFSAGTLSAVTEISNGMYSVDFLAGDLNGTVITLRCTATAADDLFVTIKTSP